MQLDKIKSGVFSYLDAEVIPKLKMSHQFGVLTARSMFEHASPEQKSIIINNLLKSKLGENFNIKELCSALSIYDSTTQNINLDGLHQAAKEAMTKMGSIDIRGLIFTTQDIDKLHQYIKNA